MPELPEVETIRRQLEGELVGRHIDDAWAFPHAKFDQAHDAVGGTFTRLGRRGKYLIATLSGVAGRGEPDPTTPAGAGVELVVHLGMTGRLAMVEVNSLEDTPHLRASWTLDDGRILQFVDVRRFGRIAVVDAGDHRSLATLDRIGPEPFDDAFDAESLRRTVNASRRAVKTQLLAQRVVAGVGNIYADEALWRAGVNGARIADKLTRRQLGELLDSAAEVMREALGQGGTSFDSLYVNVNGQSGYFDRSLNVYGREGRNCHRCGAVIRRDKFMNRSSYYCPRCQPRPRTR